MPPKRSAASKSTTSGDKSVTSISTQKKAKQQEEDESSTENEVSQAEKQYLLERELAALRSKVKKTMKEITSLRAAQREEEFSILQNPELREEKFPELSKNVKMWTKHVGATLDRVTFAKENDTREWMLQGSVEGLKFEMTIMCATDEETKKGYVQKFSIKCHDQHKIQELQPWLEGNAGNIEQILKILKAYGQMAQAREAGLEECKSEFGDLVSVSREETGEIVIDLGTEDAYFFQIKWKIVPSLRHFSRVKNICRIACTQDGDKYIKANTDLAIIKKRLSQSPIEVIQMLAKGMAGGQTTRQEETG